MSDRKEYMKDYLKRYRKENSERLKKYQKQYRTKNKEKLSEQRKQYRINNFLKIRESQRQWREKDPGYYKIYSKNNLERRREREKLYYKNNPERVKEENRKWYKKWVIENRKKRRDYLKRYSIENRKKLLEYRKRKLKTDLKFNLNHKMSREIHKSLKGDKAGRRWETLTGYTLADLLRRLNNTMPKGYTRKDFLSGELHIDHIIPIKAFNFTRPEHTDFKRCWALSNLRLLPAKENLMKHAKLDRPFQPALRI